MGKLVATAGTVAAWLARNGVAALLCVMVAGAGFHFWQAERGKRLAAELHAETQRALNDSTQIVMAQDRLRHKREVQGLITAADEMHGTLVAALRIAIAQRDTTIIHDTLPTDTQPNGTRTATFNDTTFAGMIAGTVTAPPFPAPLTLSYSVTRPAFSPQIGFVRVGNKDFAVVVWQGEEYRIEAPFMTPRPVQKRFAPYAEVHYDLGGIFTVGGGMEVRLPWQLSGSAGFAQRLEYKEPTRLQVGVKRTF